MAINIMKFNPRDWETHLFFLEENKRIRALSSNDKKVVDDITANKPHYDWCAPRRNRKHDIYCYDAVGRLYSNRLVLSSCTQNDLSGSSSFSMIDGVLHCNIGSNSAKKKQRALDREALLEDLRFEFEFIQPRMISKIAHELQSKRALLNTFSSIADYDEVNQLSSDLVTWRNMVFDDYIKSYHSELEKKSRTRKESITLDRQKVIDRATAFAMTYQAKKFMAFYSLSFPVGISEDLAYKVLNNFLTACRKYHGLYNYLWVKEFQENGTPHFHLLTCDWMDIRDVNNCMANCLKTAGVFTGESTEYYNRQKRKFIRGVLRKENYNGVDVQRVRGDRKRVIAYITKYITKEKRFIRDLA